MTPERRQAFRTATNERSWIVGYLHSHLVISQGTAFRSASRIISQSTSLPRDRKAVPLHVNTGLVCPQVLNSDLFGSTQHSES